MFHRQSSNSIKQLKCGYKIILRSNVRTSSRVKDTARQKVVAHLHFVEKLPSWSPRERKIMDAPSTSHDSIRSLKFPSNERFKNHTSFVAVYFVLQQQFWNGCRSRGLWHDISGNHSWPKCSHPSIAGTGWSAENRFFPSNRPPKFRQNRATEPAGSGWIATS